jgi:hypothetical protein
MNQVLTNAFVDELEKLSSKKKKSLLATGAGLAALGVGGLLLRRGRKPIRLGRKSSTTRVKGKRKDGTTFEYTIKKG